MLVDIFNKKSIFKNAIVSILKAFLLVLFLYLAEKSYIKFFSFVNLLLSTESYFDLINHRQNINIQKSPILAISLVFYQSNVLFAFILSLFLIVSLIVSAFLLKS